MKQLLLSIKYINSWTSIYLRNLVSKLIQILPKIHMITIGLYIFPKPEKSGKPTNQLKFYKNLKQLQRRKHGTFKQFLKEGRRQFHEFDSLTKARYFRFRSQRSLITPRRLLIAFPFPVPSAISVFIIVHKISFCQRRRSESALLISSISMGLHEHPRRHPLTVFASYIIVQPQSTGNSIAAWQ